MHWLVEISLVIELTLTPGLFFPIALALPTAKKSSLLVTKNMLKNIYISYVTSQKSSLTQFPKIKGLGLVIWLHL